MPIAAMLVSFFILLAVSYGGFLFWSWFFSLKKEKQPETMLQLAILQLAAHIFLAGTGVYAQSSPTIDFDLTPFFDNLNVYLPVFLGVFGLVGAIAGAMALSRTIIGAVVRAFSGGSI